ncbi:MAG: hypothetical protein M3Y57_08360 [Acidobacteriota bacterium]|nr:hypothetical protein [Acidobacteriota bacterium]
MSYDPSHDSKHETFVQHHGPVHSEPHAGHHGTNYEGTDASVKIVLGSLIIIAVTLIVSFAITIPIHRMLRDANPPSELPSPLAPARVVPPTPLLQVHPWEEFPDLLAQQEAQLHSYGKDPDGHVHIPISSAVDAVVSKLNIRPNATPGYMVPGGQGRDFAGSLGSMPPAYQTPKAQTPTIQGEIHKNAQSQVTH